MLFVFKLSFGEVQRLLEQTLRAKLPHKVLSLLHIRKEHARFTAYSMDLNGHIWSAVMFVGLTTQIPINVFFITYLLFRRLMALYRVVLACFLVIQSLGNREFEKEFLNKKPDDGLAAFL